MSGKVFFDTTVLVYAFGEDGQRTPVAEDLLRAGGVVSVHVLNEFVAVARRKLGMSWEEAADAVAAVRELCEPPVELTVRVHEKALAIGLRYGYHIYDALVLAAAMEAGCTVVCSEDMQHGQRVGTVTIRNPFR